MTNAKEMLANVREHKSNCAAALISGNALMRFRAETDAKRFLMDNYAMILDIVDDHLTERLKR